MVSASKSDAWFCTTARMVWANPGWVRPITLMGKLTGNSSRLSSDGRSDMRSRRCGVLDRRSFDSIEPPHHLPVDRPGHPAAHLVAVEPGDGQDLVAGG